MIQLQPQIDTITITLPRDAAGPDPFIFTACAVPLTVLGCDAGPFKVPPERTGIFEWTRTPSGNVLVGRLEEPHAKK